MHGRASPGRIKRPYPPEGRSRGTDFLGSAEVTVTRKATGAGAGSDAGLVVLIAGLLVEYPQYDAAHGDDDADQGKNAEHLEYAGALAGGYLGHCGDLPEDCLVRPGALKDTNSREFPAKHLGYGGGREKAGRPGP